MPMTEPSVPLVLDWISLQAYNRMLMKGVFAGFHTLISSIMAVEAAIYDLQERVAALENP